MKTNPQKEITDRILAQLRAGVVPWKQPWSGKTGGSFPRNAITGRAYSGANVLTLWGRDYPTPLWATYKQIAEVGGQVRKGEKSTAIIYLSTFVKKDKATGEDKRLGFLKTYNVFNVAQADNIPEKYLVGQEPVIRNLDGRIDLVEEFIRSTKADIRHGGGRAFFTTNGDYIQLPEFETFKSADAYYATTTHELGHWTGHETRLNRTFGKRFGDDTYSAEELVAELTSAFVCSEFGIDNEGQDAAYIAHWIKFLGEHENAIVSAASAASKATEFLRGLALAEDEDELQIAA
jgi:antirestriction protein ArdC